MNKARCVIFFKSSYIHFVVLEETAILRINSVFKKFIFFVRFRGIYSYIKFFPTKFYYNFKV